MSKTLFAIAATAILASSIDAVNLKQHYFNPTLTTGSAKLSGYEEDASTAEDWGARAPKWAKDHHNSKSWDEDASTAEDWGVRAPKWAKIQKWDEELDADFDWAPNKDDCFGPSRRRNRDLSKVHAAAFNHVMDEDTEKGPHNIPRLVEINRTQRKPLLQRK